MDGDPRALFWNKTSSRGRQARRRASEASHTCVDCGLWGEARCLWGRETERPAPIYVVVSRCGVPCGPRSEPKLGKEPQKGQTADTSSLSRHGVGLPLSSLRQSGENRNTLKSRWPSVEQERSLDSSYLVAACSQHVYIPATPDILIQRAHQYKRENREREKRQQACITTTIFTISL
jgi:hypothetical protein